MLDYAALKAMAKVVETGSFEKAAAALSVTPSAVSQRVRQLEERMGAALIVRGQPCIATEQGERLCRHIENVGLLEGELLSHLPGLGDSDAPQKAVTLPIATNADSLGTWFLPAIARHAARSGHLVNIAVDDEEHTADWLARGKVVAAVTSLEKPVTGCRRIALGALTYHATATPDFVARHFAEGVTAASLSRAPAVTFNQKDRLQARFLAARFGRAIAHPTHWLPSTQGFVAASLAGMGWCMNPTMLVRDHLDSGRLVEILPGETLDIPLFWQINRLAAERLSGLTRAVVETAALSLTPPSA